MVFWLNLTWNPLPNVEVRPEAAFLSAEAESPWQRKPRAPRTYKRRSAPARSTFNAAGSILLYQ